MNTFSINPNTQSSISAEQHRLLNLLMLAAAAAIVIGLLYWWSSLVATQPQSPIINQQTSLQAEVANIIKSSPVHVSAQEVNSMALQLSVSKVKVTDAEKQAAVNSLNQGQ